MITQLQVLNRILQSGDYSIITDNNITSEFFPDFQSEFTFINKHFLTYGKVPDQATFLDRFKNFTTIEVNEPNDFLVEELLRKNRGEFLKEAFNEIRNLINKGKIDEALNLFISKNSQAMNKVNLDDIDIMKDISRYDDFLDRCNNFDKHYLSTGLRELDESLGGGLDRQNAFTVVAARAGVGKTYFLLRMAETALRKGLKVGFYEGEMEVNKLAFRFDSIKSHISGSSILNGNISVTNTYKNYLDNLGHGEFHVLTRDMTPNGKVTVSTLESFVEKHNLDVLFVDQISLIDCDYKNLRTFEQVAEISKGLKLLQVRKHIPVIAASQQNRSSIEDGNVAGTENLALSDRLGQDASEVFFLSKKDDVLTINIAKARDGAKQYIFKYEVNFDRNIFTYIGGDKVINDSEEPEQGSANGYGEVVF